jgi:hypothetical protein
MNHLDLAKYYIQVMNRSGASGLGVQLLSTRPGGWLIRGERLIFRRMSLLPNISKILRD